MESIGFVKGRASPCNFRHDKLSLKVTVHGDDFAVAGPKSAVKWFQTKMRGKYDINTDMLGPEGASVKEVKFLSRIIRWTEKGLEYEPDIRHAELIIRINKV